MIDLQDQWWTWLRVSLRRPLPCWHLLATTVLQKLWACKPQGWGLWELEIGLPWQVVWISLSEEIRKTTNFIAFRTTSMAHFFNFDFPKLLLKIPRKKGQKQKKKEKRRYIKGEKRKQHDFVPSSLQRVGRELHACCFYHAFSDNMLWAVLTVGMDNFIRL